VDRALCPLAIVPVRKEPDDRSEMTTQWLFGETADVLERHDRWSRLRLDHDGYEGWVDNKQFIPTSIPVVSDRPRAVEPVLKLTTRRSILHLPMGAVLPSYRDGSPIPITGKVIVAGRSTEDLAGTTVEKVMALAPLWLGAPYLWGGRTPWGVDCSGLTQMLFLLAGVRLPRDASQQVSTGVPVKDLAASRTGDLAFFSDPRGRIVHVGIVIADGNGGRTILHASGRVRIDQLVEEGIFNEEEKRNTHTLARIRRVVPA